MWGSFNQRHGWLRPLEAHAPDNGTCQSLGSFKAEVVEQNFKVGEMGFGSIRALRAV